VKFYNMVKQRMSLWLNCGSDVRKNSLYGNHHVPDSVIQLYVHEETLIAHMKGLHTRRLTFGQGPHVRLVL